jgi:putative transposase
VHAVEPEYANGLTLTQHQLIRQELREAGKNAEDTQALIAAKYQIARSLEQLITSRKQKTRRRAAQVHGITSAKPQARLESSAIPVVPAPKPVLVQRQTATMANDPPALLQAFRLAPGGSQ